MWDLIVSAPDHCLSFLLYRNVTIENASTSSKAYAGDNGSTLCLIVIPIQFAFKRFNTSGSVNVILAFT